jgi:hypothetical protein
VDEGPHAVSDDKHTADVRTLPDIRGLVAYAVCSCGWRGTNHPSIPTAASAVTRATADMHVHLADSAAGAPIATAGAE